MEKEDPWLRAALSDPPEQALQAEFARLNALPPDQLARACDRASGGWRC